MTVSLAIVAQCPPLRGISQDARAISEVVREIEFRKGERLAPLG